MVRAIIMSQFTSPRSQPLALFALLAPLASPTLFLLRLLLLFLFGLVRTDTTLGLFSLKIEVAKL